MHQEGELPDLILRLREAPPELPEGPPQPQQVLPLAAPGDPPGALRVPGGEGPPLVLVQAGAVRDQVGVGGEAAAPRPLRQPPGQLLRDEVMGVGDGGEAPGDRPARLVVLLAHLEGVVAADVNVDAEAGEATLVVLVLVLVMLCLIRQLHVGEPGLVVHHLSRAGGGEVGGRPPVALPRPLPPPPAWEAEAEELGDGVGGRQEWGAGGAVVDRGRRRGRVRLVLRHVLVVGGEVKVLKEVVVRLLSEQLEVALAVTVATKWQPLLLLLLLLEVASATTTSTSSSSSSLPGRWSRVGRGEGGLEPVVPLLVLLLLPLLPLLLLLLLQILLGQVVDVVRLPPLLPLPLLL